MSLNSQISRNTEINIINFEIENVQIFGKYVSFKIVLLQCMEILWDLKKNMLHLYILKYFL